MHELQHVKRKKATRWDELPWCTDSSRTKNSPWVFLFWCERHYVIRVCYSSQSLAKISLLLQERDSINHISKGDEKKESEETRTARCGWFVAVSNKNYAGTAEDKSNWNHSDSSTGSTLSLIWGQTPLLMQVSASSDLIVALKVSLLEEMRGRASFCACVMWREEEKNESSI